MPERAPYLTSSQHYFCLAGVAQTARARSSLAREALISSCAKYQDGLVCTWYVFSMAKGRKLSATSEPWADVQIFYSRTATSRRDY